MGASDTLANYDNLHARNRNLIFVFPTSSLQYNGAASWHSDHGHASTYEDHDPQNPVASAGMNQIRASVNCFKQVTCYYGEVGVNLNFWPGVAHSYVYMFGISD